MLLAATVRLDVSGGMMYTGGSFGSAGSGNVRLPWIGTGCSVCTLSSRGSAPTAMACTPVLCTSTVAVTGCPAFSTLLAELGRPVA